MRRRVPAQVHFLAQKAAAPPFRAKIEQFATNLVTCLG
jgi:hypothetical protein